MNILRQRLLEEMTLRQFSDETQSAYVRWVVDLSKIYHCSPDTLSDDGVVLTAANERNLRATEIKPVSDTGYRQTKKSLSVSEVQCCMKLKKTYETGALTL